MVPCLSHFPTLCLEAIFKYVPLVDLLQSIGLVCTNWYAVRHTELARRRRLVIVDDYDEKLERINRGFIFSLYQTKLIERVRREDGTPWATFESLKSIQFDALILKKAFWNIPHMIPFSLEHLSNITHLVLSVFYRYTALPQMIRVIDHTSAQLIDLKLDIASFVRDELTDVLVEQITANVTDLFACLDRLPRLQHLRMRLLIHRPMLRIHGTQLAFLSRLRTFAVQISGIEDELDWLMAQLGQHRGTDRTIELYNEYFRARVEDLLRQVGDTRLGASFRALSVIFNRGSLPEDLSSFCTRFSSLTKLVLVRYSMSMRTLARFLARMRQLVQLTLKDRTHFTFEGEEEEEDNVEIARIPSVLLLSLSITTCSHHDTEQLYIPDIFPNIQVLRLEQLIDECPQCRIYSRYTRTRPPPQARLSQCKRLSLQPFRRCPKLHTIAPCYHPGNDGPLITIDEL